jgi:hypothetical protein
LALRNKPTPANSTTNPESLNREEAVSKWRLWVEQELGGSAERIEVCALAALSALDSNKSAEDAATAARDAGLQWDSQHSQGEAALAEAMKGWRTWIENSIGGSPDRVNACLQAAALAVDQNKTRDEIVSAAQNAATAWDSQHPTPVRRNYFWIVVLSIVVVILSLILASQLKYPMVILRNELLPLGVLTVLDVTAIFWLIRSFRR